VAARPDDDGVAVGADSGVHDGTVDGRRKLREDEPEPEGGRTGVTAREIVSDVDHLCARLPTDDALHRGGIRRAEVGSKRDHTL